jgi:F-type H+-transporting ATPase subunit epsilon
VADSFKFELVSPERLLLSEDVDQVLVPGSEGDFTMLANHAPVLAILRPGLLDVTLQDGKEQRYYVRGGFAEAGPDGLTVLARLAINIDELDRAKLNQEIKNAEEDVADAEDDERRHAAQDTLDRLRSIQQTLKLG